MDENPIPPTSAVLDRHISHSAIMLLDLLLKMFFNFKSIFISECEQLRSLEIEEYSREKNHFIEANVCSVNAQKRLNLRKKIHMFTITVSVLFDCK